jgi:hypothetical protein
MTVATPQGVERHRAWTIFAGLTGIALLVVALVLLAHTSHPLRRQVLGRYSVDYAAAIGIVLLAGVWLAGSILRPGSRWAARATRTFRATSEVAAIVLFVFAVAEGLTRLAERPLAGFLGSPALVKQYPKVTLNSRGLRDPERPLAKAPGTWRLAVLGDSFMYGHGVADESTCVRHLERALRARSGPPIEVINLSHIGFNTAQERTMLDTLGVRYHPDLVLVSYVLNDPEEHYLTYPTLLPGAWARAMEWSSFYYLVRAISFRALVAVGRMPDYATYLRGMYAPGPAWDRHREALRGIVADAKAAGARVVVAVWPYADRPHRFTPYTFGREQEMAVVAASEAGAEVLDLYPVFATSSYDDFALSSADSHPNARSQRRAAAAIDAFLESHGLLPDGGAARRPAASAVRTATLGARR